MNIIKPEIREWTINHNQTKYVRSIEGSIEIDCDVTVKQLIKALQKFDQDAFVSFVADYPELNIFKEESKPLTKKDWKKIEKLKAAKEKLDQKKIEKLKAAKEKLDQKSDEIEHKIRMRSYRSLLGPEICDELETFQQAALHFSSTPELENKFVSDKLVASTLRTISKEFNVAIITAEQSQ